MDENVPSVLETQSVSEKSHALLHEAIIDLVRLMEKDPSADHRVARGIIATHYADAVLAEQSTRISARESDKTRAYFMASLAENLQNAHSIIDKSKAADDISMSVFLMTEQIYIAFIKATQMEERLSFFTTDIREQYAATLDKAPK